MTSLIKCKVMDCSFNGGEICSKQDIYVSGGHANRQEDTSCKSFAKDPNSFTNSSYGHTMNGNFGGGAFSNAAAPHTSIDCDVTNCMYNSGRACNKNEISVGALTPPDNCQSPDQTCCNSFREK